MARTKQASSVPIATQPAKLRLEDQEALSASIESFTSELAGTQPLTAPVQLPNQGELAVRLVNRDVLRRLDELRSDASLFQGIFFTVLGALLGSSVAAFSAGEEGLALDQINLMASAFWLVGLFTFGWLWRRASERSRKLYEQIFAD